MLPLVVRLNFESKANITKHMFLEKFFFKSLIQKKIPFYDFVFNKEKSFVGSALKDQKLFVVEDGGRLFKCLSGCSTSVRILFIDADLFFNRNFNKSLVGDEIVVLAFSKQEYERFVGDKKAKESFSYMFDDSAHFFYFIYDDKDNDFQLINESKFWEVFWDLLKPKVTVLSNGYGEDAIALKFATMLRQMCSDINIRVFPLVGDGKVFKEAGFKVLSPSSVMPSGGIVKYSVKELITDIKSGLLKRLFLQFKKLRSISLSGGLYVCVGDVFLFLFNLLATRRKSIFISTAKTVKLGGFYYFEKKLLLKYADIVFARDVQTAFNLKSFGINAVYRGNPVMDLLKENLKPADRLSGGILFLPGSRERAYNDFVFLLDVAIALNKIRPLNRKIYILVAPTVDIKKLCLIARSKGWSVFEVDDCVWIANRGVKIWMGKTSLDWVIKRCCIVVGLGGTANQLCAGVGMPVVSIDEKGKRIQKKLIGDGEVLVEREPYVVAKAVITILEDVSLYFYMSRSGINNMGSGGCLRAVLDYIMRDKGYNKLVEFWKKGAENFLGKEFCKEEIKR